jgi:dihydroceramidase
MVATLLREAYLLTRSEASRTIPDKKKAAIVEVLRTGAFTFLFGFFVWNLDNVFCDPWTRIKRAVGWPTAFFMEGRFVKFEDDCARAYRNTFIGHAWWHVFTVNSNFLAVLTDFND